MALEGCGEYTVPVPFRRAQDPGRGLRLGARLAEICSGWGVCVGGLSIIKEGQETGLLRVLKACVP